MTIARYLKAGIRKIAADPKNLDKIAEHTAKLPADDDAGFLFAAVLFAGLPKSKQRQVTRELRAALGQTVDKRASELR